MNLHEITKQLVVDHKGILAADESANTTQKRFDAVGIPNTEENRRAYRDLLFTAPGIEQYISGVILFDETIRQASADGTPFPVLLNKRGIVPGIKVDLGTEAIVAGSNEVVTKGLDGLPARLTEYYALGARFAKWRAVFTITNTLPSDECIAENVKRLAQYAKACQEAGIVPMVEPEVLKDGTHTIERDYEVTTAVLKALFAALAVARVDLTGMLLKPNMVIAGTDSGASFVPLQIADYTVRALNTTVPADVAGVAFLSGGQTEEEACATLNAIAKFGPQPWPVTFSYSRALQTSELEAWQGDPSKVTIAQEIFLQRAKFASLARDGEYSDDLEV